VRPHRCPTACTTISLTLSMRETRTDAVEPVGPAPGVRKARIAHVAVSEVRSGTEQILLDLVTHFAHTGHEVSVLVPRLPALARFGQEVQHAGASLEPVGPLFAADRPVRETGLEVFRVLRRIRPDVVHFHVPWAPACYEAILAAWAARVPLRIRTEQNPVKQPQSQQQRLKMRVLDASMHHLVYVSESNRRSHATNMGRRLDRTTVIPNGVDPSLVNGDRAAACRRAVRTRLGLPLEPEIAVILGALIERKGPLDFVRAARVAADLRPSLHFAILGDGGLRTTAQQLATELAIEDKVHFLGHRTDARQLLGGFDIFVQPSHYEGMALTMLEALAAGLPMVTTRVDGVRDVLPDDAGALIVDIGDWCGMGRALAELAARAELRHQLAATAQRRVLDHFTVEDMCRRYADLYRSLGAAV
jgi:glycosyltransferase involved in cell wall biosynthesis